MSSQQELGKALVECLKMMSSLLRQAHSLAVRQQRAIVINDAEEITITCRAQEEVMRRIGEADKRTTDIADDLARSAGLDPETADNRSLLEAAGHPYANVARHELEISPFWQQTSRKQTILTIISCKTAWRS